MTQEKNIKIVGGPGKFELMVSFFEGRDITFTLAGGKKIMVRLNTIQREDGSNQSWNINGYPINSPGKGFRAYYTTRGNDGVFNYI
jgi:hypothetical protein